MHGKGGACVVKVGMHGGGMHGEGGHAWQRGVYMAGGMRGERGACVVCTPEIRPVIAQAVRILLECILVYYVDLPLNVNEVGMFCGESSLLSVSCCQATSDDNKHSSSSVFQSPHPDTPIQMALEEAYNYLQVGIVTYN